MTKELDLDKVFGGGTLLPHYKENNPLNYEVPSINRVAWFLDDAEEILLEDIDYACEAVNAHPPQTAWSDSDVNKHKGFGYIHGDDEYEPPTEEEAIEEIENVIEVAEDLIKRDKRNYGICRSEKPLRPHIERLKKMVEARDSDQ